VIIPVLTYGHPKCLGSFDIFMLFLGLQFRVNNVEISQNYFFKEKLLVKDLEKYSGVLF
jgi:hypothetical protein